jgi:SAM-dependent methyltransferase
VWPTDENREAWDNRYGPREEAHRLPDPVRERLPNIEGKHVLHLACGGGQVAAELMELGALVTGVDPSEAKLAAARQRAPDAAFFQSEIGDLPLQLRRHRFTLVYVGEGALASVRELGPLVLAVTSALRKNGRLILYDRHPVFVCVDPIGLRWRDSYFTEGLWRLGEIVVAFGRALELTELAELPPEAPEPGGPRLDPRVPTSFILSATRL